MKKQAIFILAIIFLLSAILPSEAFWAKDNTLRVCVLKNANSLVLSIKGQYKIIALKTNGLLEKGEDLHNVGVLPMGSGLSVSGKPLRIFGIKVVPKKDALVYIDNRSFRGNIDIVRTEENTLLVINHINVEDYIKGVLYHEVSHWWPMETLKAQAIAARTYALYQKSVRQEEDYDLTSDIYSQVYGGRGSERLKTNRAVDLTRSKVLTFNKEIFPTYYHATCGGRTEDASNLWDIDLAPLKGVKCSFCRHSPHYKWKYKLLTTDLEEKLFLAGYDAGGVKDIKLEGKTSSGRVKDLILSGNKALTIPAKDFRLAISPNHIRSTYFRITGKGRQFIFNGRGWGHGAGMCQWGAFFLGLKRYKAERILKLYYPGARVTRL